MPAAIVSVIATDDDVLGGVTAVTLSNVAGSFGVRNKHTGQVVVAAGTPLANTHDGVWTYDLDRDDGQIYECALEITHAGGVLRVTQDVFAAEAASEHSDSASDVVESPVVRHVDLVKSTPERIFLPGHGELLQVAVSLENPVLMPAELFAFQQRPGDPHDATAGTEEFLFIATPYDVTLYPLDAPDPDQLPGFYRKSTLSVKAASTEVLKYVLDSIAADIDGLLVNYDRLDRLYPTAEVLLHGDGEPADIAISPLTVPVEMEPSCAAIAADDAAVLAAEIAEFPS